MSIAGVKYESEIAKLVKNSPMAPTLTFFSQQKMWGYVKTTSVLERYFGLKFPKPLADLRSANKVSAFLSLGMATCYLQEAMLADRTLKPGQWELYEPGKAAHDNMVLDS